MHKKTCLFFDQVNIYAKYRCANDPHGKPSTDLSTDFVDKEGLRAGAGRGSLARLLKQRV
jgi:hypothetical protein